MLGDSAHSTITVSRDAAVTVLGNGKAVAVSGGDGTVADTALIQAFGNGGNDTRSPDEARGPLQRPNHSAGPEMTRSPAGRGTINAMAGRVTTPCSAETPTMASTAVRVETHPP